ncbi:hypothetical protein GGD65_007821 [Bradyrhizobium sp. CIR18]|nr:hypothetical protein [Bradyrhizobium sp. CIR18]
MERYIQNENIRRYRKLLEEETDEEKRSTIRRLLAEERGARSRAGQATPSLRRPAPKLLRINPYRAPPE